VTHVLIDGDIIAYRAAYHAKDQEFEVATNKADELIERILSRTLFVAAPHEYTVYLTGKGNFRFDIAKSYEYKGNRKASDKPIWLSGVRDHMVEKWRAIISDGEEADDLIAIAATKYGKEAVIASIDKDMLQVPCKHYNFGRDEWYTMDEFEGLKFFYKQILTGDTADNIVGLYRVGPAKAEKMLTGCKTEDDLWEAVVKAYDGDVDRVIENARLLWLRREEGQLWEPPESRGA
jgi:5'-3' exonuclease